MGSSIVSCLTSTVGGIGIVSSTDPNAFASAVPQIDPMFTMGAATVGFGIVGWMVGPFLGNAVWKLRNRAVRADMEVVSLSIYFCFGQVVLGVHFANEWDVYRKKSCFLLISRSIELIRRVRR